MPVAAVTVEPASVTLFVGATTQLTAAVKDAGGNTLAGRTLSWESSNVSAATVSAGGLVTAIAPASAVTISATSEGRSGSATVIVLAPVASVTVAPAAITLLAGVTTPLTATLRDAQGNVLGGRTIAWSSSNPAVATVTADGAVTTVSPGGPVTITATSEGRSGGAQVLVLAPVTSVVVTGSQRVKAGDSYTYSATARIADGSIVVRPVSWSVADPSRATMTPDGVLVPLQAGAITLRATIDGVVWEATTSAYEWTSFGSGTTLGVYLPADNQITNKFGTSVYPDLVIGCASGTLLVYVDTDRFVTHNGSVVYSFDGGPSVGQTWIESSDFSTLIYPGFSNQARRSFASSIAASRLFVFVFREFNAATRTIAFRVTGLTPRLNSLIGACQLTSPIIASGPGDASALAALLSAAGRSSVPSAESRQRAATGAMPSAPPTLARVAERPAVQQATRRQ